MAKKKKSVKVKKPSPATQDVASNSGDDTPVTVDKTAVVDETEPVVEEKVAVETPTETNEEVVGDSQEEIASEDLDLKKESEENHTTEEEKIANDDAMDVEAKLPKKTAEEEAAKLAAEAETVAKKLEEKAAAAKLKAEQGRRTVRGDFHFLGVHS
jgi:hypothetical protein